MMDFRTVFEQVPEAFDQWRPRYCEELFRDLIDCNAAIFSHKFRPDYMNLHELSLGIDR